MDASSDIFSLAGVPGTVIDATLGCLDGNLILGDDTSGALLRAWPASVGIVGGGVSALGVAINRIVRGCVVRLIGVSTAAGVEVREIEAAEGGTDDSRIRANGVSGLLILSTAD